MKSRSFLFTPSAKTRPQQFSISRPPWALTSSCSVPRTETSWFPSSKATSLPRWRETFRKTFSWLYTGEQRIGIGALERRTSELLSEEICITPPLPHSLTPSLHLAVHPPLSPTSVENELRWSIHNSPW